MSSAARRAKGAGSVTQLPDGRWLARFTIPATRTRAAKRISRVLPSKRKAEDTLRALRAEYAVAPAEAAEALLPRPTYTVATYCETVWFPRLRSAAELPQGSKGALRKRTATDYENLAASHILGEHGIGHRRLSGVSALDIEQMLHRLVHEDDRSHDTARRVAQVARLLLKAAEKDRIVPSGTAAAVEVPAQRPRDEQPRLSPEEVDQVLAVLLADAALPEPPAAVLPALLLATTGVRRGEACGVRWSALSLDADVPSVSIEVSVTELPNGELVVNPPKSRASRRVLPLGPEAATALRAAQRRTPFAEWVGGPGRDLPQRPDALSKYLRTVAERTGIPAASAAHAYRRGVTDRLLAGGADVLLASRFLGHGDGGRLVGRVYAGDQRERVLAAGELLAFRPRDEAV